MNKQRGGTLLGLIIGALVGLAAALAVAVYVTKVPVPFMNKNPTHTPDSDATEAKKNKGWNPNAPLAGKNPVRPPLEAAAPSAGASAPVPSVLTPGAVTAPPAVTAAPTLPAKPPVAPARPSVSANPANPAAPAVSADPLGDLAKARAEAAPAAGSTADPFSYFIQAGAFRTPEDAEQQRAKLLLLGVQAKVSEREQSGRTVYRVRLGPFDKKEDADKAKDGLDRNSIETALVRVQR